MDTSILDAIRKEALHPISEAEENATSIRKDPSNPFSLLYEDDKPAKVMQATKDMRGNIQDFFSGMKDWNKKYIDLAAGDTAVWDRIFKYMDASMRLGWKDVLEETHPLKKEGRVLSTRERESVTPDVSKPILNAIRSLSADGWYGFKPDKNKYDTPVMRFFTPTSDYRANTITPRPKKIIEALRCVDWMSIPSDNIDGHPVKGGKEYDREKKVFDRDYKQASLLEAIRKEGYFNGITC